MKATAKRGSPVYFFAGGYEFAPAATNRPLSHRRLQFLARAFDLLHHDVLFVTPSERRLLERAGVRPRRSWFGSTRLETHVLRAKNGVRIGLLFLPELPPQTRGVPPALRAEVAAQVRRLRAETRLVVAMSPWGYPLEQSLLAGREEQPDVLLGSGPGLGLDGQIAAGGRTAWIRSYSEGKSIIRIEIFAWPEHRSTFKWTEDKNIRMTIFGLTNAYAEDPHMLELMQKMGTD